LKILLVYPEYPDTFWSFRYALKLISKKAAFPPLGLVTVAAMFPDSWEKKLVDMNITTLTDRDLRWADYVFISAMDVQRKSVNEVVARCQKLGVKTVAGGPPSLPPGTTNLTTSTTWCLARVRLPSLPSSKI